MPVVIDDYIDPVRPAVYPPAPYGTPPSAGGGAPAPPPSVTPGRHWVVDDPGYAAYNPDYAALYHASPEYQTWRSGANRREIGLGATRAEAVRRALVKYGYIPGLEGRYGDIRAEDIAAAQGNQFSDINMIAQNYNLGVNQMRRALAARGMLQTGELNIGQAGAEQTRGQQETQALNDFLALASGAVSEYTSGVSGIEGEEAGFLPEVMGGIRERNPAREGKAATGHWEQDKPVATTPPPPVPRNVPTPPATVLPGIGGPRPPYHYTDPTKPVRRIGGLVL